MLCLSSCFNVNINILANFKCFNLCRNSQKMNSNNNNNSSGSEESMIVRDMDWNLKPSELSQRVLNPIRKIVDGMTISPNPSKELIKLTIGKFKSSVR